MSEGLCESCKSRGRLAPGVHVTTDDGRVVRKCDQCRAEKRKVLLPIGKDQTPDPKLQRAVPARVPMPDEEEADLVDAEDDGLDSFEDEPEREERAMAATCKCGCGETPTAGREYVWGHKRKTNGRTPARASGKKELLRADGEPAGMSLGTLIAGLKKRRDALNQAIEALEAE